jgi:hypothetical protein
VKRPKRSDLSSRLLLSTFDYWGTSAWYRLTERFPPKLALAAIERDVSRGLLDYGVSPRMAFLTDAGRALLGETVGPSR